MAEPCDHGGACAHWKKAKQVYRETVEEVADGAGISAEEASAFVNAALVLVLFAVAGIVCFVVSLAAGGRAQILYLAPAAIVAVMRALRGINSKGNGEK